MGLFVKIAPIDFSTASRDKRELSVVKDLGLDIIVVAKSNGRTNEIIDIDGWNVHCRTTRPAGQKVSLIINRFIAIFAWARYVRKLNPDYVSGQDTIGMLIAWISTWFQFHNSKPILIYDAHEFVAGDNVGRSRITSLCIIKLEHLFIRKAALSIMVNDTIANEVQKLHKLRNRPIVVRNIPAFWEIDKTVCGKRRKEFNVLMNIDERKDVFLIMYHGGVMKERGIENIIRAVSEMENTAVIIIGNGEPSYVQTLMDLIKEKQIIDRVLFLPAVSVNILWQYIGASDAGVCILLNTCLNNFYALPNKLIESIQSEIPVIGSDFPEISKIIKEYNIGLTCDPHEVGSIVSALEEMRNNKELYKTFKRNLITAKKELCWENEKIILMNSYKKLISVNN